MLSTSTFHALGRRDSPARLILAFAAGFLAVPAFHQMASLLLHVAGIIPIPPFDMRPTAPLGVPAILSSSFWGGVWGGVFALVVPRLFRGGGASYWMAAFVFGAIALTLVYAFVVVPLKTGALPANPERVLLVGGLLNGTWGIGTAVLLRLFDRLPGVATSNR